ncbi:MAG: SUF system Fe-S cluster assembly protein [Arenicellales bacterium]|jgi:FeS assembly SUF system protein|nr:SUF system Fe-S cluster assembly protein [Arenicellales bacterium]MDP6412892.1 SUF system Fe-S cluster assembly protein [Arenicellales bacterium]MDP7451554.1 SUF system Fe-S cluster assembly protein [Arenicellales bacterium]MDP7616295.1 SUF system Fe-S cluster assembly protein [Arenicellales bacterium]|tara:strand:+ start:740 stop:1318 length:579 start_codon:yes stop_codon:yes gene_type:complete
MGIKKHYDAFVGKFMGGENEDSTLSYAEVGESASAAEFVEDGSSLDHDSAVIEPVSEGAIAPDTVITPDADQDSVETESELETGPQVTGGGDPELRSRVITALKEIYDPEIPLNIYDLGLIYRIDIDPDTNTSIDMTLTSPNCPVAESLPGEVENAAKAVDGIGDVQLELVWDPPWDMDRLGEAARLELGLF